jgi:5'-deoxynucleotidase YfbR-like HD superfamily hydrolase
MDSATVKLDIERMIEAMKFYDVTRYRHDPPWEHENKLQDLIDSSPYRRLESDAEHSWHLADTVLLLGPHFPELNLGKAAQFAILHDKVEIFTGDDLAIGKSGTGKDSHAFNKKVRLERARKESAAITHYLKSLSSDSSQFQKELWREYKTKVSPEAKFVDALDKLNVLVWILFGKSGRDNPYQENYRDWLSFAASYHRPRVAQFPPLLPYFDELIRRIKKG